MISLDRLGALRTSAGLRLHVLPALVHAGVVLFAAGAVDVVTRVGLGWGHRGLLFDAVIALTVFVLFAAQSLAHDEQIAAVECYQAQAYLQSIKTRNALTRILNAMDSCPETGHAACERRAAIRQQVRVISDTVQISPPRRAQETPEPVAALRVVPREEHPR
jgi:hypothetical protein